MRSEPRASLLLLFFSCASAGLAACGDDDGTPVIPDASIPVVCAAGDEYPGVTVPDNIPAEATTGPGGAEIRLAAGLSEDEDGEDGFVLQLYAGQGALAGGIVPGTYPLTGAELNFETCGVCVLIFGNFVPNASPGDDYFATGGTVVITQVGTPGSGRLQARLEDVTFEHVIIDASTGRSTPVGDGCTTRFSGDVVIDSPIVTASKRARTAPFRTK
jgi:hypothetical protein